MKNAKNKTFVDLVVRQNMSQNLLIIKKVAKQTLHEDLNFLFAKLNVEEKIQGKHEIFIKPNFACPEPANSGATVDLGLLGGVIDYFLGKNKKVRVGEAGSHRFDKKKLFHKLGVYKVCSERNVEFIDLNLCKFGEVAFNIKGKQHKFLMPIPVLDADFLVNVPKYKTHYGTRFSLAMKNLYGLLPGREKWRGHALGLNECIAELNRVVPSDLVVTDAMITMQGIGPAMGIPARKDIVIASNSAVIHDYGICRLQGIKGISHVELGIGRTPPAVAFYFYGVDNQPVTKKEIDLSIKLPPLFLSRLLYKIDKIFFRAAPLMEKLKLSPKKILNILVNSKTINFMRKIQN